MTVHRVREYETLDIPLDGLLTGGRLEIDPGVSGRGYFDLRLRGNTLRLQAGGWIGLIPLNKAVAIEVVPRAPISNISRILRIADQAPSLLEHSAREYEEEPHEVPRLSEVYARALIAAVREIEWGGLLREYRERRATGMPRGKILMGHPQTQLAAEGLSGRVASSWFERSADIPPNRCLKLALFFLAQQLGRDGPPTTEIRQLRRQLNRCYRRFDPVSLDRRLSFMDDPVVIGQRPLPTARRYYRPALDIALAVLRESGLRLDRSGADVVLPSLIVSMEDAFERYVRNLLQDFEPLNSANCRVLDGNAAGKKLLFDQPPSVDANPDVVFAKGASPTRSFPLVLDAKYKPADGQPARADLNQVITYAASYRSNLAGLIQPRARSSALQGARTLGTVGSLTVFQYVLDLGADDLEAEEHAFVESLAQLVDSADELERPAAVSVA